MVMMVMMAMAGEDRAVMRVYHTYITRWDSLSVCEIEYGEDPSGAAVLGEHPRLVQNAECRVQGGPRS